MGITFVKTVLTTEEEETDQLFRPFPRNAVEFEKTVEFKALPYISKAFAVKDESDVYWQMDCGFVSYNDNQLVTCVTPTVLRQGRSPAPKNSNILGMCCLWTISAEKIRCKYIAGKKSHVQPRISLHPDGNHFALIGPTEIVLVQLDGGIRWRIERDSRNPNYQTLELSPCGNYLAAIARIQMKFQLEIFNVSNYMVNPNCREEYVLPFAGTRTYAERIECAWSGDGKAVAVSSNMGHLYILDAITNKMEELLSPTNERGQLSHERAFTFDPSGGQDEIAVGTTRKVMLLNYRGDSVVWTVNCLSQTVVTMRFVCDSTLLAVSFSPPDGRVVFYDRASGSSVRQISTNDAAVLRLSVSFEGSHLAGACSDGMIRVWQLPKVMALTRLTKLLILSYVPRNLISSLPLPPNMLRFLLDKKPNKARPSQLLLPALSVNTYQMSFELLPGLRSGGSTPANSPQAASTISVRSLPEQSFVRSERYQLSRHDQPDVSSVNDVEILQVHRDPSHFDDVLLYDEDELN